MFAQNNSNLFWDDTNSRLGIGRIAPASLLHLSLASTSTNNILTVDYVDHITSGLVANGFGAQRLWRLEDDSGTLQSAARDAVVWETAATGTRKAARFIGVYDTVEREALRLSTDGAVAYGAMPGAAPVSAFLSKLGLGTPVTSAAAGGTYLGINSTSGFTGDFVRFQFNGTTRYWADYQGRHTLAAAAVSNRDTDRILTLQESAGGVTRFFVTYDATATRYRGFSPDTSNTTTLDVKNGETEYLTLKNLALRAGDDASGTKQVTLNGGGGAAASLTLAVALNQAQIANVNAATNTVAQLLLLRQNTTGTAAAGFGGELRLQLESSSTADQDAGGLSWEWATATHASRKARLKLNVFDTAVREALRIDTDGTVAYTSLLGDPPASASLAKLGLGSAIASGSASGTYLGINAAAAYAGNFEEYQVNGTSHFKATADGKLYWMPKTGSAYRPVFHHDAANGLFDLDYNGQDAARLTASDGYIVRARVGIGWQVFTRAAGTGTIVERIKIKSDAPQITLTGTTAMVPPDSGNLLFQGFDFGSSNQMFRVSSYTMMVGKFPLATSTGDGALHVFSYDTAQPALVLRGIASQTAVMQKFQQISSTSTARDVAYVDGVFADSTDATRKGRLVLSVVDFNATREGLRLDTDGTVAYTTLLGVPPASASLSRLGIGAAIASGDSDGTYFGINAAAAYAGDLVHWQTNGTSCFRVDPTGSLITHASSAALYGIEAHVANQNPFIAGFFNDTYSTSVPAFQYFSYNTGVFAMGTEGQKDLHLCTGGYNRAWLTIGGVTGHVGIGAANGTATSGAITLDARLHVAEETSGTNAIRLLAVFDHNSSGTPAAGFGHELRMRLDSSTTQGREASGLSVEWATATDATRKARVKLNVWDTAAREGLRIDTDGAVAYTSLLGNPPASAVLSKLQIGAALVGGSANGTFIGVNSGTLLTADLMHLQNNGASRFSVTAAGQVLVGGGQVNSWITFGAMDASHPLLSSVGTGLELFLADFSGNAPFKASTLTASALGAGSVVFAGAGGLLSQDNANLFWDDASNILRLGSGAMLGWSTDLFLHRAAANRLAQRNGLAAQTHDIYYDYTDNSNYARLALGSSAVSGGVGLATEIAGTGTPINLVIYGSSHVSMLAAGALFMGSGNVTRWIVDNNYLVGVGNLLPYADNSYDIGDPSYRVKDAYLAGMIYEGGIGSTGALAMRLESSTTQNREAVRFATSWASSTDATRKARGILSVYDLVAREALRVESDGTNPMVGFLGAAASARIAVNAAAVDPATTMALVNQLRAAGITFGLLA